MGLKIGGDNDNNNYCNFSYYIFFCRRHRAGALTHSLRLHIHHACQCIASVKRFFFIFIQVFPRIFGLKTYGVHSESCRDVTWTNANASWRNEANERPLQWQFTPATKRRIIHFYDFLFAMCVCNWWKSRFPVHGEFSLFNGSSSRVWNKKTTTTVWNDVELWPEIQRKRG